MNLRLATLLGVVMALVALGVSLFYWSDLPDPMPIHFDGSGHPTDYGSRYVGALLSPGLIAFFSVMFLTLPWISPKGYGLHRFEGAVARLAVATEAFLLLTHLETLNAARLGKPFSLGVLTFALGALLAVVGNQFGKVRRNFFIGVRTPWTLADEEVWLRTHRLAGKLFCAVGVWGMLLAAFPGHLVLLVVALVAVALVAVAYSFVVYRRLHPNLG